MRILLSNDDGYLAPGLRAMYEILSQTDEVVVVAPERDHSGASKRTADLIPLCHPLPLTHVEINFDIDTDASSIHCQAKI